ncbi:hypothetical protein NM688_g7806 [Phlebia brevispora]|uniref:Uncharacterized protein n=1 Tax=Phlebia brevispora TaxID=194682 RepID=A0ACC1S121_9APHY|nr:hypothetical protein NM688_g7806 [Phlebia brevispora]
MPVLTRSASRVATAAVEALNIADDPTPPAVPVKAPRKTNSTKRKATAPTPKATTTRKRSRTEDKAANPIPAAVVPRVPVVPPRDATPPVLVPAQLTFSFEDAKQHLIDADSRFEDIFARMKCRPFEHLEQVDPFRTLTHSILGQQISWMAARSITHRFVRLFDPSLPEKPVEHKPTDFFPSAHQVITIDIPTLRTAGLSQRKAEYVLDLAARFADGRLSTELLMEADDEALYEMLTAVRGIGRWTVDMFAIFSLRRPDILPVGDLGVQRGVLRWFLSLHSPSFGIQLSPKKVPKPPTEEDDEEPEEAPKTAKKKKATSKKSATSGANDAEASQTVPEDASVIPPAPNVPMTPGPNRNSEVDKEDTDTDEETNPMPTPFTPSINKILNKKSGLTSDPPRLPEGMTVNTLKSRLNTKNKVKGAILTPQEMQDLTEPWRPYRSLGVYYMWALAEETKRFDPVSLFAPADPLFSFLRATYLPMHISIIAGTASGFLNINRMTQTTEKANSIPRMAQDKEAESALALPLHATRARPKQRRHYLRLAICALLAAFGLAYLSQTISSLHDGKSWSTCSNPGCKRNPAFLVKAKHGAVASENELCSMIGVRTLKKGGNAVDAAISTTLCIGVVNMFSSGLGGGGFMTVRLPPNSTNGSSEVYTIDFREIAPAAAHEEMYVDDPLLARWGGLSVGVPGELRGLQKAHELWGSVPWRELVEPSIHLARGWKVSKELERRIDMFSPLMLNAPEWKEVFAPNGCLLHEGEIIRRTALARTLETIAQDGADAFYKGPIADAILNRIRATGGVMTQQDLDSYGVKVQPALQGTYRGRSVYTTHAPTSGPVLLHMLNLAEKYDNFVEEGLTGLNAHRIIEIMKFGFAARTKVGDPAFLEKAEADNIDEIPTKKFAAMVFPNITDERTHPPEYYNPVYDIPIDHGTSHSSIVDRNGMVVGITSTVNLVFGSAVLDPVTGIILNDEMDDFSIPGVPNAFGLWPSPCS